LFSNDAPSGLTIGVNRLKGIRLSSKFTPTNEGVPAINSSSKVEKMTFGRDELGYVTFGVGMSTQEINDALDPSGVFTMGAAHGNLLDPQ
jgi:hypothetical protein